MGKSIIILICTVAAIGCCALGTPSSPTDTVPTSTVIPASLPPSVPTDHPTEPGTSPSSPPPTQTPVPVPTSLPTPILSPTPCLPDVEAITADLGIPASVVLDYPRVDSSTSAYPLQVLIACKVLGVPCVWYEGAKRDWTRWIDPVPDHSECNRLVTEIKNLPYSGTHDAYMNLIAKDADFILVARSPSEEELQAATDAGVTLDVQAVALDAFVILVHVDNPVDSLQMDVVRRIYAGEITDWGVATGQQVMGLGIHAYRRDAQSGSQQLMERLVMQGTEMADFPDMIHRTMAGPLNTIGGSEDTVGDSVGIGYSVYFYATHILPHERVKLIGIDGVLPMSSTIASGAYPLTTEVYAVIREGVAADDEAALLRDWLFTQEGQAVVEESGYVPVAP